MRVLALCAGIGGLERGIEAAGVEVEDCTYVERDPYAAAVLAARVASGDLAPGVVYVGDVAELGVESGLRHSFDLITAGFPCQPASTAGKRLGRDDERWIWPQIADIIEKCEPRAVLLENVRGLLTVDGGAGFREVLERLAACGLDARWTLLRASDVGAPHRRERVFVLGYRDGAREDARSASGGSRQAACESGGELLAHDAIMGHAEGITDDGQVGTNERTHLPEARRSGGEVRRDVGPERVPDAGGRQLPLSERRSEGRAGTRPDGARDDLGPERVPDAERDALRHLAERGPGAARAADGGDAEPRYLGSHMGDANGSRRTQAGGGPLEHAGREPEPGRGAVADADPSGCQERRQRFAAAEEHAATERGSGGLADADGRRREGERGSGLLDRERAARGRDADGCSGRTAWPPGPKDAEGWRRWLAAGGPAPAVNGRLSADFVEALMGFPVGWTDLGAGDAARRERLRCLGNAVVPAQAALAWEVLVR